MTTFKDHFSKQSQDYARYRPNYPPSLFQWLASLTAAHELAWDVGTGNGQAALALADHYRRVIATDPAEAQLRHAVAHERVTYKVMPAEHSDLGDASVDLVTVAQALHWFEFERFYREVQRVLRPGGVIAVWAYGLNQVSADVDPILGHYYTDVVGSYWPPERRYIDEGYRTVPFPFMEIHAPAFRMEAQWNLHEFVGYLETWSAGQRYRQARGHDPIELARERLCAAWGPAEQSRTVSWPIYLRAGKMPSG